MVRHNHDMPDVAELETARAAPVFSLGWITVTVAGVLGIVLTWLIYPMNVICLNYMPGPGQPDPCAGDPRLLPAVVGTVAIFVFWLCGTIVRSRTVGRRRVVGSRVMATLTVVAAIVAPIVTLWEGGFSIPLW